MGDRRDERRAAPVGQRIGPWLAGARPRTLPAAAAPVLAGVAAGIGSGLQVPTWRLLVLPLLCVVVALALQVGVNYANDYSDGIRGTDDVRVGPTRLTASGLASPGAVRAAAFASFGVAAVAGLAVVALSGFWWLLAVGAAAILAAWFYTGGSHPYGYLGLGELMVFVFFGLVATVGTTLVTFATVPPAAWPAAVGVGALASALLVVNNLRDLTLDAEVGKRTLATRLGDRATRLLFVGLIVAGFLSTFAFAALTTWWALLGLAGFVLVLAPVARLLAGAVGRDLIAMLQATSLTELALAAGLLLGVAVGS